jgi:hypothetical protein
VQDKAIRIGREAAERLLEWEDIEGLPCLESEDAARAAIEHLGALMESDHRLFRASRQGAERGAESLSPRPFQGVLEALQNADDLGADELRLAVRKRGNRRDLLIVHNGARVQLGHVGAMVLPWVTTKGCDADASGRWGIGQMTLRALGGPIELHCSPYHFRMEHDRPRWCDPFPAINSFYSPERPDTLLRVPLLPEVDVKGFARFLSELGSVGLLFLRHVRRLYLIERGKSISIDLQMDEIESADGVLLQLGDRKLLAERVELCDPHTHRRYTRYLVEQPLTRSEQRHHKETGKTATLGVAFARSHGERGGFYDRLPLPIRSDFPFSLNAQFDPDTGRSTVLENRWNENRLSDLGELLAAAGIDCFARQPANGWWSIPLENEIPNEIGPWLAGKLRETIINHVHHRIGTELRFGEAKAWTIDEVCYEMAVLDGLLTSRDQELLVPGYHAIPTGQRDQEGRWRSVLLELNRGRRIDVQDALNLFDQDDEILGVRKPRWFVAMARAAIEANVLGEFLRKRGMLLLDGSRAAAPGQDDPRSLVCRVDAGSLAAALSLALQVNPAYLTDDKNARLVAEALRKAEVLIDEADSDDAALRILARGDQRERVRLNDRQLLALRNAFERIDEDHQRELGPSVGANIELRSYVFAEGGKAKQLCLSPNDAYLPAAIDRETDSFAKAAYKTPNLLWLDGAYAKLLKRASRRELGAQRFLVRLGARTAPRLIAPTNEVAKWKRDPRPASPIHEVRRPSLQKLEIEALSGYPTYLLHDRWSPDLAAVILSIQSDRNALRRRHRGLALLRTIARAWERSYADYELAEAVDAWEGNWQRIGNVTATWLAFAASERWLPSATGGLEEPRNLCLPTEPNLLAHRGERGVFLARVDEQLLRSPALVGLRLKRGPSTSNLVARLRELRDGSQINDVEREVITAYHLLALACPDGDPRGKLIGDMTAGQLRAAFAGDDMVNGLLFIDGGWHAPHDVFVGAPIFGKRRWFVPNRPEFALLWRLLQLKEPDARECVSILRELAQTPLKADENGVLMDTLRYLSAHLEELPPMVRTSLRRLALWDGNRWLTTRPLYAVEDNSLAKELAERINLWRPGFTSFTGLERLMEVLCVTPLRTQDFLPVSLDSRGAIEGEELRPRFARAIEHLRDELLRSDRALCDSLCCSWKELCAAAVLVSPDLEIAMSPSGHRRVTVPAKAHLLCNPLALVVRSPDDVATAEAGGRAIGSLFNLDPQKIAWAWVSMWQRAGEGPVLERLLVQTGFDEESSNESPLLRLKDQIRRRAARRGPGYGANATGKAGAYPQTTVRQLKDLSKLQPDDGKRVNVGAAPGGVILPSRKPLVSPPTGVYRSAVGSGLTTSTRTRSVLPPVDEREHLAFEAVRHALRANSSEFDDLRKRRGIGADAIDDLLQFYEIKMTSGAEMPDTVRLLRSEVERAQGDTDFFLAVVSGLENESGELRVRFIFEPLKQLSVRIGEEVVLSGVRQAEALEFVFHNIENGVEI